MMKKFISIVGISLCFFTVYSFAQVEDDGTTPEDLSKFAAGKHARQTGRADVKDWRNTKSEIGDDVYEHELIYKKRDFVDYQIQKNQDQQDAAQRLLNKAKQIVEKSKTSHVSQINIDNANAQIEKQTAILQTLKNDQESLVDQREKIEESIDEDPIKYSQRKRTEYADEKKNAVQNIKDQREIDVKVPNRFQNRITKGTFGGRKGSGTESVKKADKEFESEHTAAEIAAYNAYRAKHPPTKINLGTPAASPVAGTGNTGASNTGAANSGTANSGTANSGTANTDAAATAAAATTTNTDGTTAVPPPPPPASKQDAKCNKDKVVLELINLLFNGDNAKGVNSNPQLFSEFVDLASLHLKTDMTSDPAQKKKVEKTMEAYVSAHPELHEKASEELKKKLLSTYQKWGESYDQQKINNFWIFTEGTVDYINAEEKPSERYLRRLDNTDASAILYGMSQNPNEKQVTENDAASVWAMEKLRQSLESSGNNKYKLGNREGNLMNFSVRVYQNQNKLADGSTLKNYSDDLTKAVETAGKQLSKEQLECLLGEKYCSTSGVVPENVDQMIKEIHPKLNELVMKKKLEASETTDGKSNTYALTLDPTKTKINKKGQIEISISKTESTK